MKTYYRIVRDHYAGYEVQCWRWWFPFWIQPRTNTKPDVEEAKQWAIEYATKRPVTSPYFVEYLGPLP